TTRARVGQDQTAIQSPCENQREHLPSVVGLPPRSERELITPCHEDATRAPIGQRGQRKVAKLFLDRPDVFDVVGARALGAAEKFAAYLIALQNPQQRALRRHYLARDCLVVTVDELRCARLTAQWRAAFPGVPIRPPRAISEFLRDRVNALQSHAHVFP